MGGSGTCSPAPDAFLRSPTTRTPGGARACAEVWGRLWCSGSACSDAPQTMGDARMRRGVAVTLLLLLLTGDVHALRRWATVTPRVSPTSLAAPLFHRRKP